MTKHYFKREAESEFGAGTCYFEIENGWIIRQAEKYVSEWRWGDANHPEWLADQPEAELGIEEAAAVDDLAEEVGLVPPDRNRQKAPSSATSGPQ
ncbi:MAG: hypothetical protein ACPG4T_14450 [Nannocystaceae bacterium]